MTGRSDSGWCAPATRRPTRRGSLALVAATVLALAAWAWFPAGWSQQVGPDPVRVVQVVIDERGRATIEGEPARRRVLARGSTRFLGFDRVVSSAGPVRVRVRLPAGVELGRVATRSVRGRGEDARLVLVTVPASAFPGLRLPEPDADLLAVVEPLDARVQRERRDLRLQDRLRDAWWFVLPIGVVVAAVLPLLAWRITRRRFLSMRTPGAGRTFDAAPPSSLDPIGAALLRAGAGPVDHQAAFAGHVLDLVERRQLRMRRSAPGDATGGSAAPGVRIGLAGVDDDAVPDDPAIAALRTAAEPDLVTVEVPDDASRVRRAAPQARDAWVAHVQARARFERILERWPWRLVAGAAIAVGAVAAAAATAGLLLELPGRRAITWLVAAVTTPGAVALAGWSLDARRWRIVARPRRLERAQWLAWRDAVAAPDGPEPDPRTLPLRAATGTDEAVAPPHALPGAVALDAATADTVRSLRALLGP